MKDKLILVTFFIIALVSALFISRVNVNYNLEAYLPDNSEIKDGLNVYYDEFTETSNAYFVINETQIQKTINITNQIQALDNVEEVIYVDDHLNQITLGLIIQQIPEPYKTTLQTNVNTMLGQGLTYPEIFINILSYLPSENQTDIQKTLDSYIKDEAMLFQVVFSTTASDMNTSESVDEIKLILEENSYEYHASGNVISTIFTRDTIEGEVLIITLICVPLVLVVLLILSKSYMDILLFGIVIGVSIIINLGTNIFLTDISFITKSMAIVLQLAISLDYVIFYLNSYHNHRDNSKSPEESIRLTKKQTTKPILASALTTAVSFLALLFMRFTIGFDIGIVFSKAIIISLLSTLFLLPILIRLFSKQIDKTRKKAKMQYNYSFIEKLHKFRYVLLGVLIVVLSVSVYFHSKTKYTYGSSSFAGSVGSEYYEDVEYITDTFGYNNQLIIILPKDDIKEASLYQELNQLEYVDNINAGIYYKSIITNPLILSYITDKLYSDNYALIQFNLLSPVEGEEAFSYYEEIKDIIDENQIDNAYILGETSVAYNIKSTVSFDYNLVMVIALIAVMIIIFITFRNLFMPILLPLVIETSVFFTLAVLSFLTKEIVFLASLIVSAILLGVTIDYAILLSKSYLTAREKHTKKESIAIGVKDALPSIIISATLFSIAGLTVFFISSIQTISQIGLIIGLGAIVSLIYVILILPQLLSIFDSLICRSKIKISNN